MALAQPHVEPSLDGPWTRALFESLVESLPQNIFRKDRAGRLTFANRRYCETLKSTLTEVLGKTDFDLFPRELALKYVADDQRVMQTGEPFETVETHHLPGGADIFVQVVKTAVRDDAGRIVGVQGIFWDVTEKIRAERVLAESEHRYRELAEATLDGIVLADEQGVVMLFNPAAERIFGYAAAEVIGRPVSLLVPEGLRSQHEDGFRRYLATRQARMIGRTVETEGRRKDGSLFPVEIALNALQHRAADGRGPGALQFLAAIRDLTERNRIRGMLLQNEKLASIGLLSAGVAHEINNPLAFVGNNLAVLDRDCSGLLPIFDLLDAHAETLREQAPAFWNAYQEAAEHLDLPYVRQNLGRLLERTRAGVERVTRIVHSLRSLARTDAPQPQPTALPDLIAGSLEILHGRFKRSGITVEQRHDTDARPLCVATQIGQVVLNLLMNAFQAVEAKPAGGGRIDITTRRAGDNVVLEIADNGVGIAPEHLGKIFDPFFTTKDVGDGTGLGLSISHNIVTAHGGRIEVDSRPDRGATFRVYLPAPKGGHE
jgi:two-component system, NtrC family, sensor kinase